MSKDIFKARAKVAGLYAYGHKPDADTERDARRGLNYAKLYRSVNDAVAYAEGAPLDPVQTGHIVALLVSGSDPEAVERLARSVREAAYALPGLTADDRATIAAQLVDGA